MLAYQVIKQPPVTLGLIISLPSKRNQGDFHPHEMLRLSSISSRDVKQKHQNTDFVCI